MNEAIVNMIMKVKDLDISMGMATEVLGSMTKALKRQNTTIILMGVVIAAIIADSTYEKKQMDILRRRIKDLEYKTADIEDEDD